MQDKKNFELGLKRPTKNIKERRKKEKQKKQRNLTFVKRKSYGDVNAQESNLKKNYLLSG